MYSFQIEGDTNDMDMDSRTEIAALDSVLIDAGALWPSQPSITYKAFFSALGDAVARSGIAHNSRNWANEYASNEQIEAKQATIAFTAEGLGFSGSSGEGEATLASVCGQLGEIINEFIPKNRECGLHTITSITATPLDGTIRFY